MAGKSTTTVLREALAALDAHNAEQDEYEDLGAFDEIQWDIQETVVTAARAVLAALDSAAEGNRPS